MLMLSFVAVSIGLLIIRFWRPIHTRLRSVDRLDAYSVERLWERGLRGLVAGARGLTAWVQHGDLRRYLLMVVAGMAALIMWSAGTVDAWPNLPKLGEVRLAPAIVALIGLAGAFAATRTKSLVAGLVATGLTGFSVAITFMMNGAPDLALTQFTVEALIVVLLTALLLAIPIATPATRSAGMRRTDAIIAALFAVLLFFGFLDMASHGHESAVGRFFGEMSYVAAQGHNVVNVILVDFRAIDTLGETFVIAVSAVLAASLLAARGRTVAPEAPAPVHFSFAVVGRGLSLLLLAASIIILWRGHDQPGGGFVGGLVAALAFAVLSLAYGVTRAQQALRARPLTLVGIGMACALLSGLPAMVTGQPYLTHLWWDGGGILPKLGTTIIFDLGVYLVVLGAVLAFLFGLQREASR
jgi:multicomponent Na+:H+ antiporter subunit A